MAMQTVQTQVEAASNLLSAMQGQPGHGAASALQRDALSHVIRSHVMNLTGAEKLTLSDRVNSVQWADGDGMVPLNALMSSAVTRRPNQDYTALVHYYTEEDYKKIEQLGTSGAKLEILMMRPILCGLRNPTEPTLQLLTATYLIESEGEEVTCAMSKDQKHAAMVHCKGKERKGIALRATKGKVIANT